MRLHALLSTLSIFRRFCLALLPLMLFAQPSHAAPNPYYEYKAKKGTDLLNLCW